MCVHYITKLHTETNTVKNVKGAKLVGKHSYSPSVFRGILLMSKKRDMIHKFLQKLV